jgi:hypothetical protein
MVKLAEAQVCLAVQLYEILNEIKIYGYRISYNGRNSVYSMVIRNRSKC